MPNRDDVAAWLRVGCGSVAVDRRAAALAGAVVGAAAVAVLKTAVGLSPTVLTAAVGAAVLAYVAGVEAVCRRYGHAVDCASGNFCECERCGRPVGDA